MRRSPLLGMRLSLFDTRTGLSMLYVAITLPFVIWMMLSFIDEVPYTLEHAARIMGAGRIYTLRKVVLPLVASGMVVTFLFVFILNWAEFLLALTLTHPDVETLPVLLNKFQSASEGRLYGPQAAIGTVITVPVVILGVLIQKHLVKGFSFGTIRRKFGWPHEGSCGANRTEGLGQAVRLFHSGGRGSIWRCVTASS